MNKLQNAIDSLADMFEGGHLASCMRAENFLEFVAGQVTSLHQQLAEAREEIERKANTERLLNAEIGAHHKELREKAQALSQAQAALVEAQRLLSQVARTDLLYDWCLRDEIVRFLSSPPAQAAQSLLEEREKMRAVLETAKEVDEILLPPTEKAADELGGMYAILRRFHDACVAYRAALDSPAQAAADALDVRRKALTELAEVLAANGIKTCGVVVMSCKPPAQAETSIAERIGEEEPPPPEDRGWPDVDTPKEVPPCGPMPSAQK